MMWELVGAIVGAGLASGREIASFFAQYGYWGYAGIAVTCFTLGLLGTIQHPISWRYQWLEELWRLLLTALLVVTGGAMLSGAGEIAEMVMPIKGAYWIGQLATMAITWFLARRSVSGFARICKVMLIALGVMMSATLLLPRMKVCAMQNVNPSESMLRGLMYGGFNAAVQVPILADMRHRADKNLHVWYAGMVCGLLLSLGNAVILHHPMLLSEPMPFLAAVRPWGYIGYLLYALCLYLAVLSTLTACLKGLRKCIPVILLVVVSQLGFTGVVDILYPILGSGCFVMLIYAKFAKNGSNPFHSREDVL